MPKFLRVSSAKRPLGGLIGRRLGGLIGALLAGLLQATLLPAANAAPAAPATATHAAVLRIASAFDPQTLDPHAVALLYHTRVTYQVYDSLVNRDQAFKIEPALALSWQNTNPTTWRFKLRPGV